MPAVGVMTGARMLKGLALLLSAFIVWGPLAFMFLDSEIHHLAGVEQGPAYGVGNSGRLGDECCLLS